MRPGQAGPAHAFDAEQVWSVLGGGATLHLAGDRRDLAPGDTAVLPPGVSRRIVADPEAGLTAIVAGAPGARASMADGTDRGVPPWIA